MKWKEIFLINRFRYGLYFHCVNLLIITCWEKMSSFYHHHHQICPTECNPVWGGKTTSYSKPIKPCDTTQFYVTEYSHYITVHFAKGTTFSYYRRRPQDLQNLLHAPNNGGADQKDTIFNGSWWSRHCHSCVSLFNHSTHCSKLQPILYWDRIPEIFQD